MRIALSISLLFIYLAPLFRPAYPFLNYEVNQTYFEEVLCVNKDRPELHCHGKCHLKLDVQDSNNQEGHSQQLPNKLPEVNAPRIQEETLPEILRNDIVFISYIDVYSSFLPQFEARVPVPPPRDFA